MGLTGVLMFLAFTWLTVPSSARAGEFPKNLAFLAQLPVVITGECLYDSDGRNVRFGPCEARVGRDTAGGYRFYLMETVAPERLDGVQSFTLSARPVAPPAKARPEAITVVVWGMCSGQELGLREATGCEVVVFPDPSAGERIFLRLTHSPAPAKVEFFEVYRGAIILAERATVRQPEREESGDGTLLLADVLVAPEGLTGVPPELGYLARFRKLGTVLCNDVLGHRAGMCQVFLDEETRNHYFLMHWRDRLWRAWRVNGEDRRWEILWSAPSHCEEGDLCA